MFDEAHKAKNLINLKGALWSSLHLVTCTSSNHSASLVTMPAALQSAAVSSERHSCCSGDATQTGKTVEQLQLVLPRAKVIYSSATGASEPNNLVCCWRSSGPVDDLNCLLDTMCDSSYMPCAPKMVFRNSESLI